MLSRNRRSTGLAGLAFVCTLLLAASAAAQDAPRSGATYLAEEDTFSFGSAEFDTLTVSAERVSVEEIIRAIGERLEADDARIETQEFTILTTVIARENDDPDCDDFTMYESAMRQRVRRGSDLQSVLLWEREREYRDGELKKEEREEEEMQTEWGQIGQGLSLEVPFSPATAGQYDYVLDDRLLIGNNVIYKVLFTPRNRFDPLPSGTVWVDYSDLVLRRFEARFVDAVPMPLFLKKVPFLRVTAQKLGDFWVADEVHARAELRSLPLPDWPANMEMRVVMKDYVINGIEYDDEGREVER